jgi:hypothetical protein
MVHVVSRHGIPIWLQSMFVSPCTHCGPPGRPEGGAIVPASIKPTTTSDSSHQGLKLTRRTRAATLLASPLMHRRRPHFW